MTEHNTEDRAWHPIPQPADLSYTGTWTLVSDGLPEPGWYESSFDSYSQLDGTVIAWTDFPSIKLPAEYNWR